MSDTSRQRGTVLVIGAAGTLGRAICTVLAGQGAAVWAADSQDCHSVVAGLGGSQHRASVADVTDERSVDALIGRVWATGSFAAAIYAAGTNYTGPIATTSWPDYDRVMGVNLRGAFHVGKAVGSRLRTAPRDLATVFLSSVAGLKGEAGGSVYCASKFALVGFVESFASEIAQYGGRANAVCPGNVDSVMLRQLAVQVAERQGKPVENLLAEWSDAIAFRRLIEPAEVAHACAWLVTAESSGISGQTIVVDGPPAAG